MELDGEKLVELVEQRPAIYNFNLKEYCNKNVIDKLWGEIASELNSTAPICRMKWINIRNCYARHIREIKKPLLPRSKRKKRYYYLAETMDFMKEYIGQHQKLSNSTGINSNKDIVEMNGIDPFVKIEEKRNSYVCLSPCPSESSKENNLSETRVKKIQVTPEEMVADPMVEFLKPHSTPQLQQPDDSPTLHFLKALLPDIETLTGRRQRKFKQKVLELLYSLMDEQEEEQR